ncbi:MAG: hypothetical protein P1V97_01655 [Planctomycetota bacterium]|nr:hypothetical protein [Planctomycetota bacterium]
MWYRTLKPLLDKKQIHVVGIVQEQHPERTRLYKQWKQYSFPMMVDSLNLLGFHAIPIVMGLDESGIVRYSRMKQSQLKTFLATTYKASKSSLTLSKKPDMAALKARKKPRDLADAYFLYGSDKDLSLAVSSYQEALKTDPKDSLAQFRLGVALRRRYESRFKKTGDDQGAIESWTRALSLNPNQYIWRRRIQQYGPQLNKPYNFYAWIEKARSEIRKRGETPLPLSIEARGTEIMGKGLKETTNKTMPDPDPKGQIHRDKDQKIQVDVMVTPKPVRPGERIRVRLSFRPKTKITWNNEAGDVQLHLDWPKGIALIDGSFSAKNDKKTSSSEKRVLELELSVDKALRGSVTLKGYVCYQICTADGSCLYLRQDLSIPILVHEKAPSIR